jgi:hypothetical protein
MSATTAAILDPNILRSVAEHVFMPPKLPQVAPDAETDQKINVALCDNLVEAAQEFLRFLPISKGPLWKRMIKMMKLAHRSAKAPLKEVDLRRTLSEMDIGGMCG